MQRRFVGFLGAVCALYPMIACASTAPAPDAAALTLGDEVVLRLRAAAGGMTPQQRVGVIESRLAAILGTPNIRPTDVVVYTPAKGAPVIYALGRRLITVDAATVHAAGTTGLTPLETAKHWAARFQQILPRVNWRPSNALEPKIPEHPPLAVTNDFTQVGGNVGIVVLRGKTVLRLHGPQLGGLTAQERADMLTARLQRLANNPQAQGPDAIAVATDHANTSVESVAIQVGGVPLVTVDASEAKLAGMAPAKLAGVWAANIRSALGLVDPDALPAAVAGSSAAAPPAVQTPAADATAPPSPSLPPVTSPPAP